MCKVVSLWIFVKPVIFCIWYLSLILFIHWYFYWELWETWSWCVAVSTEMSTWKFVLCKWKVVGGGLRNVISFLSIGYRIPLKIFPVFQCFFFGTSFSACSPYPSISYDHKFVMVILENVWCSCSFSSWTIYVVQFNCTLYSYSNCVIDLDCAWVFMHCVS